MLGSCWKFDMGNQGGTFCEDVFRKSKNRLDQIL